MKSPGVRLGGAIITNPAKPFWPDEGLTKLDLAQFLRPYRRPDPAVDEEPGGDDGAVSRRHPEVVLLPETGAGQPARRRCPTSRSPAPRPAATSITSSAARARRC